MHVPLYCFFPPGRFKTLVVAFLFYWGGFAFLLVLSMMSKCARDAYPFLDNLNISLPYCEYYIFFVLPPDRVWWVGGNI